MKRLASPALAVAVLFSLAGCSKQTPAEPAAPATTADTAAGNVTPAPAPLASAAGAPKPDDTLFGLLAAESKQRPAVAPNTDGVFAALEKAGFGVAERKQSLGRTYKAAYCSGGYTKDMALAVDVCEYPDEASAQAGLATARALFPQMSNRTVQGHKSTLLIVINQKGDATADARAKKLAAAYAAT